jgi:hypothetical protein
VRYVSNLGVGHLVVVKGTKKQVRKIQNSVEQYR